MKTYFFIAAAALITLITVLFLGLRIPGQKEQLITYVNYSNTGNFDYLVTLKPSYLFGPEPEQSPEVEPSQSNSKYPSGASTTTT